MKVSEILSGNDAIKALDENTLLNTVSFRLSRLESKIDPIIKSFEKANNDLIIKKHGKPIKEKIIEGDVETEIETKSYYVPEENMEDYIKDVNELLDMEEELNLTIKMELFEGAMTKKESGISMKKFYTMMGKFIEE